MEQTEKTEFRKNMLNVKHKILIMSNKGGVGKSTVAVNLALVLARKAMRVGLLDIDIHGPCIPKMLGLEEMPLVGDGKKIQPVSYTTNLKVVSMAFLIGDKESPVIWRGPLKMKAIQQFLDDVEWGMLDFLIIDSPPGTGDEPLSIAQLVKDIDGVIIVTTPQEVALLDSRKAVNFAKKLNMPVLGIIENMSGFICPHCGKRTDLFKTGGGERAAKQMGVPFLGRIPIEPEIVLSGDEGRPFVWEQRNSQAVKAFGEMVEQIMKNLKPKDVLEKKGGG
ncbi:MAG: Mrp/NBP35 family ATP-binding protein [candidate division Zixibacteria bacterium]|nr:Mrp/NBP35 family ATP-binding protein [candidate division Zixibacteria bacterium]